MKNISIINIFIIVLNIILTAIIIDLQIKLSPSSKGMESLIDFRYLLKIFLLIILIVNILNIKYQIKSHFNFNISVFSFSICLLIFDNYVISILGGILLIVSIYSHKFFKE
jgi:hypothetical protein